MPDLAGLKVIVKHLGDMWPAVLHRRAYMLALAQGGELRAGLDQTYAANVHSAIQQVLLIDLLRELGALVLDANTKSASVANSVRLLRSREITQELEAEYRMVPPMHPQLLNEMDMTAEQADSIRRMLREDELRRNLDQLAALPAALDEIEQALIASAVGQALWKIRCKGVAHYDVVQDGADWRLWRVEGLTYGQLDAYVEATTEAIDKLSHFVRRSAFDFPGSIEIAQKYAAEYVEALTFGLQVQRRQREEKRAEIMQRAQSLGRQ